MATIARDRARLVGFTDSLDAVLQTIDQSGTTFEFRDLVTRASTSGIDKATGGASDVNLAMAADPDVSQDPYYEPIPAGSAAYGDASGVAQVFLLDGQEVEMSTSGTVAESDMGVVYALAYDSSAGVPVVDLSTSSTSGFKILRLADEVYGGTYGDTDARVIGRFTSDVLL